RDGEANADRAARLRIDRGIDADHPGVHVDEGPAGIAGIDGGVGLDEEAVVGHTDLRARDRRDDALRYGLADAERIAHSEYHVADFDRIGVAEFHHREARIPFEFQHRKVGTLIAKHDRRFEFALVQERDFHVRHAFD